MTSIQYKFTNLCDIEYGELYNVIGVVKYFQNPEKSRGTGYKTTISITDQSMGYDKKLTCNIFNNKRENLPRVSSRGDIIIMHRLKIGRYNDKHQGTGAHTYGFASAVICHEDVSELINKPYEHVFSLLRSESVHFNLTREDFEKVRSMVAWGNDMPDSQEEATPEEVNIDTLRFNTLSLTKVGDSVSLAVQIVSIITVDTFDYKTILLVWDGTNPNYDLNKKFISHISKATSVKHCITLMAKLGGKLSNPYLTCVLFKENITELSQSFVGPGDLVYLRKVTVSPANSGPGVVLVGEHGCVGPLPPGCPLIIELSDRINRFSKHIPCVADCVSPDIATLNKLHLRDVGKLLGQLSSQPRATNLDRQAFKVVARVAAVHPSSESEFQECLMLFCLCCQRFHERGVEVDNGSTCRYVPVPKVTVVMEDFTGWLTTAIVGQAVLALTRLVMIDASHLDWWLRAPGERGHVQAWLTHIDRLTRGWVEAKLVLRDCSECGGTVGVVPFLEDLVILDNH